MFCFSKIKSYFLSNKSVHPQKTQKHSSTHYSVILIVQSVNPSLVLNFFFVLKIQNPSHSVDFTNRISFESLIILPQHTREAFKILFLAEFKQTNQHKQRDKDEKLFKKVFTLRRLVSKIRRRVLLIEKSKTNIICRLLKPSRTGASTQTAIPVLFSKKTNRPDFSETSLTVVSLLF